MIEESDALVSRVFIQRLAVDVIGIDGIPGFHALPEDYIEGLKCFAILPVNDEIDVDLGCAHRMKNRRLDGIAPLLPFLDSGVRNVQDACQFLLSKSQAATFRSQALARGLRRTNRRIRIFSRSSDHFQGQKQVKGSKLKRARQDIVRLDTWLNPLSALNVLEARRGRSFIDVSADFSQGSVDAVGEIDNQVQRGSCCGIDPRSRKSS